MTSPPSSPPNGYPLALHGEFPDVESVAMDILAQVQVAGAAIGPQHVGTRPPLDAELPFVHIYRDLSVGGLNAQGWEDSTSLYVGTWADTRRDSQEMIREVRRLFGQFRQGGAHRGVWIDAAWESAAPGGVPDADEDDRQIASGWMFVTRQHWDASVFVGS